MSEYNPDRWAIVKFKGKDSTWYKVLGSWYGGYLDGDSWRLSSGLERIEQDGDIYHMHNFSGSVYICHKNGEGMHMTAAGILSSAEEQGKENGVEVSVIDVEQFNKEQAENEKK